MNQKSTTIIPIDLIVADENQPRKLFEPSRLSQLKSSIKRYGIMNPLRVEKIGDKYLLEDGERRWRAAKELGIKEVPAIILDPETGIDRMVKQFHVQEQHEGWTPTEKAMVVWKISQELGVNITQMADLLALSTTTAARYIAFSELVDKKAFEKNNIGLEWAAGIKWVKTTVKSIYSSLDKEFTRTIEKGIESGIIDRIKSGELKKRGELTKMKDSFIKNPKMIDIFLDSDITISKMFIDSKAKGAYYLRNAYHNAAFTATHIRKFMENPDVKPTESQVSQFKSTRELLTKLLNMVE